MNNSNSVEKFWFEPKPHDGTGNGFLQPTRVTSQRVHLCINARKSSIPVTAAFLRLGFQPEPKPPPSCDYRRTPSPRSETNGTTPVSFRDYGDRRSTDNQLTAGKTKLIRTI